MQEVACERVHTCNVDQRSFKAYLSRWMAMTAQLAPFTHDRIFAKLRSSAQAAARTCNGAPTGNTCSIKWWEPTWDGSAGVGEQMSALSVIGANLVAIQKIEPPVTQAHGISKGNPTAGIGNDNTLIDLPPPTKKDKIGAGVFTGGLCLIVAATLYGMLV